MNPIEEFQAITNASADDALKWLEIGDFDLETSIELYMSATIDTNNDNNQVTNSNKREFPQFNDPQNDPNFDFYEDLGDYIRKPDDVKRMKMVDESYYVDSKAPKPVISTFTSGSHSNSSSSKDKALSELYKPPTEIISPGDFEMVKTKAMMECKWLLVNIQNDSEFSCHLLNRDFWHDELIQDLINCSFVFWQQLDVSAEGEIFISRYKVKKFPFVGFIDPRTGACVWRKEGNINNDVLGEKLQDYIETKKLQPVQPVGSYVLGKKSEGLIDLSKEKSTINNTNDDDVIAENNTISQSSTQPEDNKTVVKESIFPSRAKVLRLDMDPSEKNEVFDENDQVFKILFRFLPMKESCQSITREKMTITVTSQSSVFTLIQFVAEIIPESLKNEEFDLTFGFPRKSLIQSTTSDEQKDNEIGQKRKIGQINGQNENVAFGYLREVTLESVGLTEGSLMYINFIS